MMRKKKDEDRKPIEEEIAELQRKFRCLENDKRAYSEDSQGIIRKQRATIEKLTRENRKMKSEVNENRGSGGSHAENRMAHETIGKLGDSKDTLLNAMDQIGDENKELSEQLDTTAKKIFSIREEMCAHGGVNAALENTKAVQKQIRVLENRLDKSLQKFNDAIAANKVLREQIDTLRRERLVFDEIYRKLENELSQKKKEMANIIEQANAAYEARDSAQAQMAALKQQADKEHSEFEKEWRELGRLIESDKRMKEFMKTKARGQEREQTLALAATQDKSMSQKKANTQNAWDTGKSIMGSTANQDKTAAFEDAFAKIQAATGICDIDELVQTFSNGEDQNFGLFKYNNLLRVDIEKLEQQISDYKEEYITLSGTSNRREDTEKLKVLEALEERWTEIERKADSYDIKYQEAQQTLSHIRASIDSIFSKMGCSSEDLPTGCSGGISEANMMSYLGVIENRMQELLKAYDAMRGDEEEDVAAPPKPVSSSAILQIKLPSTVEDDDDEEDDEDEDDQRPFTRDELKSKTLKNIGKKMKKGKK
jgi:chromosome segregation ATPase